MKYPKESLPKKPSSHIVDKKYGVFQSEIEAFKDVTKTLGLPQLRADEHLAFNRHPLAFLVEAADDICYTIIDFEDGINLGLIDEEFALEYLINLVRENIISEKYYSLKSKKDRVSYLRALAIGNLVNEAATIFFKNETAILNGDYNNSLLDKCKYEAQINDIIKISVERIYRSKDVVEKEVAGYRVLSDLLDVFILAINNSYNGTESNYDKLILRLLPENYQIVKDNLYDRISIACSFISIMSDSYAILLHKKIKGEAF
jgi:dGTPase